MNLCKFCCFLLLGPGTQSKLKVYFSPRNINRGARSLNKRYPLTKVLLSRVRIHSEYLAFRRYFMRNVRCFTFCCQSGRKKARGFHFFAFVSPFYLIGVSPSGDSGGDGQSCSCPLMDLNFPPLFLCSGADTRTRSNRLNSIKGKVKSIFNLLADFGESIMLRQVGQNITHATKTPDTQKPCEHIIGWIQFR